MKKFFAFVFVSAFFCASFAENFQYAYTVNVQNESGAGYNLEISYPVFGGKLKAVDKKIAESVETDVEFLKRKCTLSVLETVVCYSDYVINDWNFKKKFDSLTGGYDLQLPTMSDSQYKDWLMSSKGTALIKLLKDKLSEQNQEIPYSYSYYLNFQVFVSEKYLSVYLDVHDWTTGGNGNHEVITTVNYDLEQKSFVTLEDVTGLSTRKLVSLVADELNQRYDSYKADAVRDRSGKGCFPLFTVSQGTVTVYFNPYEIASGAEGVLKAYLFPYAIQEAQTR